VKHKRGSLQGPQKLTSQKGVAVKGPDEYCLRIRVDHTRNHDEIFPARKPIRTTNSHQTSGMTKGHTGGGGRGGPRKPLHFTLTTELSDEVWGAS